MIRNRLHHHRLIAICVFVFHVHLSQCNTTTSSVFKVNDPGSKSSIYEEIILLDAFDNQIDQFDDSVAGTISSSSESSSISTSFTALPDLDASLEWISDKALLMANVRQISVCALDTPKRRCLSELYYLIDLKFGSAGKPFNDSELNVTCRRVSQALGCLARHPRFRFLCSSTASSPSSSSSSLVMSVTPSVSSLADARSTNDMDFVLMYLCSRQAEFRQSMLQFEYVQLLSCVGRVSDHLASCLLDFWHVYQTLNLSSFADSTIRSSAIDRFTLKTACCGLTEYSRCVRKQPTRCSITSGHVAEQSIRLFVANLRALCLQHFGLNFDTISRCPDSAAIRIHRSITLQSDCAWIVVCFIIAMICHFKS